MTIPCHFIIQNLRREYGYYQRDIAAYLSVSVRSYSDYETGITRIRLSQLISLAKLYNVDMNYICGISEERRPYPIS